MSEEEISLPWILSISLSTKLTLKKIWFHYFLIRFSSLGIFRFSWDIL
jgi:hypothetical protein